MGKTQEIGRQAEETAAAFLQSQGLTLIVCNYRCEYGEIDLVMQDHTSLVFVEVRFRDHDTHGNGAETITGAKKSKLIKSATHYLLAQGLWEKTPCRFDVISLSSEADILWISDAFWVKW